jgi:hypothetical protein
MALMSACATIADLYPEGGSSFYVHDRTYEQVWMAAVSAASRYLTVVEREKGAGVVRAEKGAGLSTFGQVVGIFISPASEGTAIYTVRVVSKERYMFQFSPNNWESTIIEGMRAELAKSIQEEPAPDALEDDVRDDDRRGK